MSNEDSASHQTPSGTRRKIVVGYDGSPPSVHALNRALTLAPVLDLDVRLIVAWSFPVTYSGYGFNSWSPEQDALGLIEVLTRERFGASVPSWFTADAIQGRPAEVLISNSRQAEMLILGSRGHGGFVGLLVGSVSVACVEYADCPVLVMRPNRTDAR